VVGLVILGLLSILFLCLIIEGLILLGVKVSLRERKQSITNGKSSPKLAKRI
jgi:hypothetical protein